MRPVGDLVQDLLARGVELWFEGDRLRFRGPQGALTPELRAELGARRDDVLAALRAEAAARETTCDLSYNQRSLWLVHREDPASAAYNVAFCARVVSPVNVAALRQALQALVDRHAILRTTYPVVADLPVQRIAGSGIAALDVHDAAGIDEGELRGRVEARYRHPFDLERGPVLRADLYSRADADHVLLITAHHIAVDGLSQMQLLDEFRSLYAEATGGPPAGLARAGTDYADFTRWQAQMLEGPEGRRVIDYWRTQLAEPRARVELPTDRRRQARRSARGATLALELDAGLSDQLRLLARNESATLYVVLLAAFKTLLFRYTGTQDVIVGTPTFGRDRPETTRLVGDFVNTVALRSQLDAGMSPRELLAQLRRTLLGALEAQDCPFALVVETLHPARDPHRSPLFEIMFVLQNFERLRELAPMLIPTASAGSVDFGGLRMQQFALAQQLGQFELTVEVIDIAGPLSLHINFDADIFDESTIERMAGHYRRLLEGFVARPDARIDELAMLSEAESAQMLLDWNRTAADPPAAGTVHGLFEAQVARTPQAVAVSFEDEQVDYRELNARANRLARHLRALGVGAESLVGVWMERSLGMVVALLGILKAGGAYVPLDPAFPKDRIDYMIADAALAAVVTQESLASALPAGVRAVCLDRDADALAQWPGDDLAGAAAADNLAYVIYTSGSTGRPKGVELEHRSVVNFLGSMQREPGFGAADRFVSVTTLSFDIAGLEIYGPLTCGGTVVLASRATATDGARLAALLESSRASVLQATPATWRMLLDSGWPGRPGLKMLCGGEALPHDLAEKLLATRGELWNLYGPTETTIWSTLARVRDASRTIPIGRPIANTQVFVLEPSGLPAPIGVGGELCIGGVGLARGYRNRPELTTEKFVTLDLPGIGPRRVYRTGDIVRFLADGQLEYIGRRDHQVKVRGFRIELGEIEAMLSSHEAVRQCVVVAHEVAPGDTRLVAYLVYTPREVPTASEIRRFVRRQLPDYMVPSVFVALDAIPTTPNGKTDRSALPDPFQGARRVERDSEPPAPGMEQLLADTWCEVLKVKRVGAHDNFFELGGHSLLALQVAAVVERKTGWRMDPRSLFFQSLRQVAATGPEPVS